MSILSIDFDGVIHDHLHPVDGKVLGPPIEGARDALCQLRNEDGHKIIIFSVKPADIIDDWMRFYEIPFDLITNRKVPSDVYLDDKGMRFHNWNLTLKALIYNLPLEAGGKLP